MEFKRLQKLIDKGITVLADHDEKKQEERYINLQNVIAEAQDYVEKGVCNTEINKELHNDIKKCIKEFEKDRIIFILFLIILCGLLFIGVFYITYSHFYDHWYHGGHFKPPYTSRPTSTHDNDKTSNTTSTNITTTSTTKTTTISTSTTSKTSTTVTTSKVTGDTTTDKTTSSTTTNTTTTQPVEDPDDGELGFVTVIFDNTDLVDIDNIYPMTNEEVNENTPSTKWKLYSTLSKGSKAYKVRYTVNFVDNIDGLENLLDIELLKFQLIAKNKGIVQYDSGPQYYDDYPEIEYESNKFYRPIITKETSGNIFNNAETLDFELRMWLDDTGVNQNDQQGKKYRFNIFVEAEYEFIE